MELEVSKDWGRSGLPCVLRLRRQWNHIDGGINLVRLVCLRGGVRLGCI